MLALPELLDEAGLAPDVRDRLVRFGRMVLEANRSFNLTGAKSEEDIAVHLLDSLTIVPHVTQDLVDIGSGAGFPAIPVALVTGYPVTLVETTRKKAQFLERVLETFDLRGEVVAERAEIAARSELLRDRFTSGTARAVGSGPTVVELVLPFIAVGGRALLQRGKLDDLERAAMSDAAPMLGAEVEGELPAGGDRRIIVIRKLSLTPQRFPRRPGIPDQRPLCFGP
jgi:16S rRNA (guanine527-N7)-methyltransferase